MIDRALQASGRSFTGMKGLGVQDCAIQESMGPIADRTKEHLGVSDTAIIRLRRHLMRLVQDELNEAPVTPPPGAAYRLRPTRFTARSDEPFAKIFNWKMQSRSEAE